jgi:hypothetical protein
MRVPEEFVDLSLWLPFRSMPATPEAFMNSISQIIDMYYSAFDNDPEKIGEIVECMDECKRNFVGSASLSMMCLHKENLDE